MLIGLSAKNAILIVEFAKMKHEQGLGLVEAALEGAKLRLRPILMTSFAFILGCVPLATASGAGALSRQVMGYRGYRRHARRQLHRHLSHSSPVLPCRENSLAGKNARKGTSACDRVAAPTPAALAAH